MHYPHAFGLDWKEYLQSQHIVRGVNEGLADVKSVVRSAILSSSAALQRQVSQEFQQLVGSTEAVGRALERGFSSLESKMGGIESAVENLQAEFSYGLALVVDQLVLQQQTLSEISNKLDRIYEVASTPMRTKARELYLESCSLLSKGLLDKAVEYFHKSEEVYDVDFFTHFQLGKLYLYGKNEDSDVIDVVKAEHHLKLAAKYGEASLRQREIMSNLVAESYFHAGVALYVQGSEKTRKRELEHEPKTELLVHQSLEQLRKAILICPTLSEAHYYAAKCNLFLFQAYRAKTRDNLKHVQQFSTLSQRAATDALGTFLKEETRSSLEEFMKNLLQAIRLDRNYVVKVSFDQDFLRYAQGIPLKEALRAAQKEALAVATTQLQKARDLQAKISDHDVPFPSWDLIWNDYKELKRLVNRYRYVENLCRGEFNPYHRVFGDRLKLFKGTELDINYEQLKSFIVEKMKLMDHNIRQYRNKAENVSLEMAAQLGSQGYLDLMAVVDLAPKLEPILAEFSQSKAPIVESMDKVHALNGTILKVTKEAKATIDDRLKNNRCVECGGAISFWQIIGLSESCHSNRRSDYKK